MNNMSERISKLFDNISNTYNISVNYKNIIVNDYNASTQS